MQKGTKSRIGIPLHHDQLPANSWTKKKYSNLRSNHNKFRKQTALHNKTTLVMGKCEFFVAGLLAGGALNSFEKH